MDLCFELGWMTERTHAAILFIYIMHFQYILVVSQCSYIKHRRQCNLAHLRPICTSSLPLSFSMGLWNGQSAVNKVDLIPAIASQTALSILGLAET